MAARDDQSIDKKKRPTRLEIWAKKKILKVGVFDNEPNDRSRAAAAAKTSRGSVSETGEGVNLLTQTQHQKYWKK